MAQLRYVGEEKTKVVTFNGVKIEVKKDEVFECSDRNYRNLRRMYARLFKPVLETPKVDTVKTKSNKK